MGGETQEEERTESLRGEKYPSSQELSLIRRR